MNDFISFNQQRAEFYWWMSSLFAKELTENDLAQYQSKQMEQYLAFLAQTPELNAAVTAFEQKLAVQKNRADGQLELAADFCELFLTTAEIGALPYAAIYLEKAKLLNGKTAQQMAQWMQKYHMAPKDEMNEPLDHLAIMLDFFASLSLLANKESDEKKQEALMQEQHRYLVDMLASWITPFQSELKHKDTFGFYAAAAGLLLAFVELDKAFLS